LATRRTQIINALISDLESNTEVASGNVHKRYKYLDEINDFPSITFVARNEDRVHYGGANKFARVSVDLRGYVFAEDQLDKAESLAANVETKVIDVFASNHRDLEVDSALVTSFRTDEGLMSPYGVADLSFIITYSLEGNQ
jgi:hypothetical protein